MNAFFCLICIELRERLIARLAQSDHECEHDMAQSQRIETMFGDGNYGFQAGTITGSVTTEFHSHAPGEPVSCHAQCPPSLKMFLKLELPETPPNPLSIPLPFDRDPDYIQRGSLLDEITTKLLRPAARVALVGLGGVGYITRRNEHTC